ncbi:hypothetical protein [Zavarzinella formosa]|uniref:hypothetical protein n=1 Tax=Zavarzinella formosa TaxID=360055 RepID=UPI0012FBF3B3|nr:hypothetical protein [Zavarzinella formosa]
MRSRVRADDEERFLDRLAEQVVRQGGGGVGAYSQVWKLNGLHFSNLRERDRLHGPRRGPWITSALPKPFRLFVVPPCPPPLKALPTLSPVLS